MVLEQGALSGKYDADHLMPEGSLRASTYNPILPSIGALIATMREIGEKHNASVAQIAIAWAIAKGTTPIIGVTKPSHVTDATKAAKVVLTPEEMNRLEALAIDANVQTRGSWEKSMV
jgi:aryl-alcohol dehydrogenase-like predicted oxidoreductase